MTCFCSNTGASTGLKVFSVGLVASTGCSKADDGLVEAEQSDFFSSLNYINALSSYTHLVQPLSFSFSLYVILIVSVQL